jgi:uncharacterized protein (TIGR02001 family)
MEIDTPLTSRAKRWAGCSRAAGPGCGPNRSTHRLALAAIVAVIYGAAATEASAEEEQSPITFNVGAFSQYVFRGLTQTDGHSALQGGADYASRTGLYAGTWLSNISWFSDSNPGTNSPIEWDLCAGYRRSLDSGVGVDVGVQRYIYPGRYVALAEGTVNPNMTELYLAASWHGVSLKYSHAVTNTNGVEHSVGSNYLDFTVTVPLAGTVNATLHAGRQAFRGRNALTESLATTNDGLYTYNDYSAGLNATVDKSWSASVLYTRTTAPDAGYLVQGRNLGSPHLAIGFVRTF